MLSLTAPKLTSSPVYKPGWLSTHSGHVRASTACYVAFSRHRFRVVHIK